MKNRKNRGLTIIELLIYTAVVAFIVAAVGIAVQSAYQFYGELTTTPRVDRVGISIVEQVIRDVRTGNDVILEESTFGVAVGSLAILVPSGESSTIEKHLAVDNGRMMYWEDDGTPQAFTPDDISVSRFLLTHITTPESEAVRVELELTFELSSGTQTRQYSGVAILRRSYE